MPISKRRGVSGAPIDPALAAMGDAYLGSRGKHAQPLPDPPRKAAGRPGPAEPDLRSAREILGPVKLEAIAVSLLGCCTLRDLDSAREVVRFVIRAADEHGLPPRVRDDQLRRDLDELDLLRALRDSIVVQRECPVCRQTITLRFFRGVPDLLDVEGIPRASRLSLRGSCPSCGQIDVRPSAAELRAVLLVAVPLPAEDDPDRPLVEPHLGPSLRPSAGREGKEQRGDRERTARPPRKGGPR